MLRDGWPVIIAVALSFLWTDCNHQGPSPQPVTRTLFDQKGNYVVTTAATNALVRT